MDKRSSLRIRVRPDFKDRIQRAAQLCEESVNKFVNRVLRTEVESVLAETRYYVDLANAPDFTGYVIASQLSGGAIKIVHVGNLPKGSSDDAAMEMLVKKFALPNLQKFEEEEPSD